MEKTKNIITETLIKGLNGHIKNDSNLNPRDIVDSIVQNIDFNRTYSEFQNKKVSDYRENMFKVLEDIENDMNSELQTLKEEQSDKMIKNFIRDQLTAIEKIKNKIE